MSSFCVSTDETHSSKRPFFSHSKQNEKNDSYLTQWHTKGFQNIKLVSLYSKSVSCENSKCLHFPSVQWNTKFKKAIFFSFQTEWKKWIIFDTMAYQKLPEYQISFPLFKVSELWKFQMSSFCVSTDEAHSSKKAIFSHSKQNEKNELYLTQWHTKGFQNIKLVSLYSKSGSRENSKCLHLASVQVKHMVQKRQCSSLIWKE